MGNLHSGPLLAFCHRGVLPRLQRSQATYPTNARVSFAVSQLSKSWGKAAISASQWFTHHAGAAAHGSLGQKLPGKICRAGKFLPNEMKKSGTAKMPLWTSLAPRAASRCARPAWKY
jgi:hypothetical protein